MTGDVERGAGRKRECPPAARPGPCSECRGEEKKRPLSMLIVPRRFETRPVSVNAPVPAVLSIVPSLMMVPPFQPPLF